MTLYPGHDNDRIRAEESKGPDTYLNGARYGWPNDHSVEDTYECPPHTWTPPEPLPKLNAQVEGALFPEGEQHDLSELEARTAFYNRTAPEDREYRAEFGTDGSARLVLDNTRLIATFETFADAQTAAKALNELKGY